MVKLLVLSAPTPSVTASSRCAGHCAGAALRISLPCGLWQQGSTCKRGESIAISTVSFKVFDSKTTPNCRLPIRAHGANSAPAQAQGLVRYSIPCQHQQELYSQIGDYRIPKFCPPWEHKINPLLSETLVKTSQDWFIRQLGAKLQPEQLHNITEANTHLLFGGVFQTTTSVSRLEWGLEFFLLQYIWDDEFLYQQVDSPLYQHYFEVQLAMVLSFPEDRPLQQTLENYLLHHPAFDLESTKIHVAETAAQIIAMEGQQMGPGSDLNEDARVTPLYSSFLRLWTRSTSVMPQEWSLRFAHILQRDFLASFLEAIDREHGRVPSVAAYIQRRRCSGFVEPNLTTIDYMEDVFLPNRIYYSPPFQRLLTATNDALCWHNDIWSLPKELAAGEVYNLVFLISKENECTYNEAAEIVNQMVVDKCQEMQLAAAALRGPDMLAGLTNSEKDALEQYIACCYTWISSTHAFHSQSKRFHFV